MACCCEKKAKRLLVGLSFKREELLYDVKNLCYVEGDLLQEGNAHNPHIVFDVGEKGNVDRVTRVLDVTHAALVEMLYPYTMREIPVSDMVRPLDDRLRERETYYIHLTLPEAFSLTTVHLLEHLVHEYLVTAAVADWLGITNPGAAGKWQEKLGVYGEKLREVIQNRTERGKIKLSVF